MTALPENYLCVGGGFGGGGYQDPDSGETLYKYSSKDGIYLSFLDSNRNPVTFWVAIDERKNDSIRAIMPVDIAYDGRTRLYGLGHNNSKVFSVSPHGPTIKKGNMFVFKLNLERAY